MRDLLVMDFYRKTAASVPSLTNRQLLHGRQVNPFSYATPTGGTRSHRPLCSILPVVLILLELGPVAAQSPEPFSTLELLAAGAADLGIGDLSRYWDSRHGGLLRLATPFHFGSAALALQTASYEALGPEQVDFRLRTATLEWNVEARLAWGASGFAGVHAGATAMNFAAHPRFPENVDENEFLTGLQAGVRFPVGGGFGATLLATHRKVYTRHPLRLTVMALGVHYTRATPARLREALE